MIKYDSACFSKGKINWGTPPELFKQLSDEFGPFDLDPCTIKSNPLGTPKFYTVEDDGLNQPWAPKTFVNPPYGTHIIEWVRKARNEQLRNDCLVVMLLPARTDTKWFHTYCYDWNSVQVRFLRGRQKMIDLDNPTKKPNTAPFPSMVVIFYPC